MNIPILAQTLIAYIIHIHTNISFFLCFRHHKVIIKVPVIEHTHKHTHTKTVVLKHGGGDEGHSHGGHGEFLHWKN